MRLTAACGSMVFAMALLPAPAFSQTPAAPDSLWHVLDEILMHPIDKPPLQTLFGAEPVASEEQYGVKYLWPEPVPLSDGLQLKQATLIATRDTSHNSVGFNVSGRCMEIPEIKSTYPDTGLSAMPTHGYPDAAVTYRTESHGRKVNFFINYYSRCLVNVRISDY